eukprot:scaffold1104_cov67-Phaeocystis_antarctica.AAC.1
MQWNTLPTPERQQYTRQLNEMDLAPHSVSWRLYNENALVLSGISECFSRAYIYTRTHNEERRNDAKTTRARVSRPEFVSVGVVSRITRPPAPTPFPEGLTWRQCHPRLPLSRVTACPLVCAVRAHLTMSAQQDPSFPIALRSSIVQVSSDYGPHLTLFAALIAIARPSHTPSWVLDTSTSTAVSTFLRLPIRPLGRLKEAIDRTLGKLNLLKEASERDAMLWRSWPFPWVAPRACATSARLTAR